MQSVKIKLNVDLGKYKKDEKVIVNLDSYWSRRIKESEIDNCLEVISENKKTVLDKNSSKKRKGVVKNDNDITA